METTTKKGKKAKKGTTEHRYRAVLKKDKARLSLGVAPGSSGTFMLRARNSAISGRITVERLATFDEAKARVDALVEQATEKGWTLASRRTVSFEDLL